MRGRRDPLMQMHFALCAFTMLTKGSFFVRGERGRRGNLAFDGYTALTKRI